MRQRALLLLSMHASRLYNSNVCTVLFREDKMDFVACFSTDDSGTEVLSNLSDRLRRLVASAINFNALIYPGRKIEYRLYMGEKWQFPRLTDYSTFNGSLTESAGLSPFAVLSAESTIKPCSIFAPQFFTEHAIVPDGNIRYILLTPDDATYSDVTDRHNVSRLQRTYRWMENHSPILLDSIRELQRGKREKGGLNPVEPYVPATIDEINTSWPVHHPYREVVPGCTRQDSRRAVIVGMHWLQAGGAERWGVETIELVKKAGLIPIVIVDKDSHQPWIANAELSDTLIVCLTFPTVERPGDEPLLRAIFEQFNVVGVLIHHCQWLYDRLPWIKRYRPNTHIIDSLHIVEYKNNGGYPNQAVSRDNYIDFHHVISPQLEEWLVNNHGVASNKIICAPLVGLTSNSEGYRYKPRASKNRLIISFVGRVSRQKRPEAFLAFARALNKRNPGDFHFILHGSGDMDATVDALISRYHLKDVVERRDISVPVEKTYKDSDLLVISSNNEGITLTTLEALSNGVPVISTDVGSQRTIISSKGLLPRSTRAFISAAVKSCEQLYRYESEREDLWNQEIELLKNFAKLKSANSVFVEILTKWSSE